MRVFRKALSIESKFAFVNESWPELMEQAALHSRVAQGFDGYDVVFAGWVRYMKKAKMATEATELESIPNIGPAVAADLRQLGIHTPAELKGQDPYVLYQQLCAQTGVMHDPCLLDTFIAATRFMAGEAPLPWWRYTKERKRTLKTS